VAARRSVVAVRDVVLLLARVGLGVVLLAHGWQKYHDLGIDQTAAGFAQVGIPLPTLAASVVTYLELVGGALLILGLLVPVVGVLVALEMAGAIAFVHAPYGVFVTEGGWELALLTGLLALTLAAFGSGRVGLDALLFRRRRRRQAEPVEGPE
jgi:putative oxidoreductase